PPRPAANARCGCAPRGSFTASELRRAAPCRNLGLRARRGRAPASRGWRLPRASPWEASDRVPLFDWTLTAPLMLIGISMERGPSSDAEPEATGADKGKNRQPRGRSAHGVRLLEHVSTLIGQSENLQETLDSIVQVVAERMRTEVCSIYLLDPAVQTLTLWATTGLIRTSVGKVKMHVDEGLTGLVIETMKPVADPDAPLHPRFKFFPETGEERYHSFLGVPILERRVALGVLIV